ncbi:response regulator transcription factor [Glaciecola sp. 33A]|uniref:response regulator transcription factor n=1 Tax=Glaciecola sp. 33A TaxID=2057807 RepID=UPI000C34027B|nr:response regulator [Glaciecola sp. 33A]PKI02993.1 DNA-binding response regulator [Glaciecola sp. 33A]
MTNKQTVFIIDDDKGIRDGLEMLLESIGLESRSFASGSAFLDVYDAKMTGCLILDIRMPKMSGLEVQRKLKQLNCLIPIIFITGHGDIPMAVEAMRLGAIDFIRKPFKEQDLIDRINEALKIDEKIINEHNSKSKVDSLSAREYEVFERVADGSMNKVIAADLGISERTVEVHRSHVMEKLKVRTLAELVRIKIIYEQLN